MTKKEAIVGIARKRLPFAPQGWPFILGTAVILLILISCCSWIPAGIVGLLLLFILNFFRDPERDTPTGDGLIIAPADGRVIRAEENDGGLRIDIFMNVFNVHVNRAPIGGRITHMHYTPGKFVNASFEEASDLNERNRFEMESDDGVRISFTQIAGLIARRIISYVAVGDRVEVGERVGMIRFGSRVDCEIPEGHVLNVKVGDHVTAGLTILAHRP
ncbi:MAG: phosphatidylserine decarboxylase family protein [Mariprofundaceae bacterium]